MSGIIALFISLTGVYAGVLTDDNALVPPPLAVQNALAVSEVYIEDDNASSTPLNAQNAPLEATSTPDSVLCSCIKALRVLRGIPIIGYEFAKDIPRNILFFEARPGDLVLFSYAPYGHIGELLEIKNEGLLIKEYNKIPCKESTRLISFNDPFLIGFHRPIATQNTSKSPF